MRANKGATFADAQKIAEKIGAMFAAGEFGRGDAVLQPLPVGDLAGPDRAAAHPGDLRRPAEAPKGSEAVYEYEPGEAEILTDLLRAISRCRSSRRCSRTARPNRARA